MTLTPQLTPSSKADLLSQTSAAALAVHRVMDKITAIDIPTNPQRTPNQTRIIAEHFPDVANDDKAPTALAA